MMNQRAEIQKERNLDFLRSFGIKGIFDLGTEPYFDSLLLRRATLQEESLD